MLHLVLGRSGCGKTEYVFSSVRKLIEEGENNVLLITPEQFSFIAEKRLLKELGESRVSGVENTSFTGLSATVSKLYGAGALPVLSKGAKAVKMKEAIETVQDSLELFEKNRLSVSFINSVVNIYDEMKSCRVSCEDINSAAENTQREVLKRKLHDVSLIISAYDALISREFYDPADELTRLYEKLLTLTYFKNRVVYIDGFNGFVAQEYKIIEVILKQAKDVYITFCTDSFNNTDKFDLFSYVNSNIRILKEVSKKAGIEVAKPIFLEKNYRYTNDELAFVEKYAFSDVKKEYGKEPEYISVYQAKNISDECDRTAFEISKLLRDGFSARDITVICRDMEKYSRELGFSFKKYNLPYFDDERQSINSQPLVMLICFLLRTVVYSYRSEDIFALLKTGLTELSEVEINELENYVYLWSISGAEWKRDFTKSTKGFVEEITESDAAKLERINKSRKYTIDVITKFAREAKNSDVTGICRALYFAVKGFSADKRLKEVAKELENGGKSALAKEQGRIWDMIIDILDGLVLAAGSKIISVDEFQKLFGLMINTEDLGSIPMGLDNIQVGSADRIRCDNPRVVFIVGANEGEFPRSVISSGLFSESDRIELIENDFKLYSYGETLNAQERYFAYMAVCAASERLYVSYIAAGDNSSPGSIVTGIESVFKSIKPNRSSLCNGIESIESKDNAFEILASSVNCGSEFISSLEEYFSGEEAYSSRLSAIRRINSNEELTLKNKENAVGLFGENMYLSASRIEDYYNCAFRYFCKFGLDASPRKKAKMDPMQTGTVIHFVLENILREKGSNGLIDLSDGEISLLVEKYLKLYLNTKMGDSEEFTPRFKYQFLRLSRMLSEVVIRLRDEFSQSDFEAKAFELEIGNSGRGVKSKKITLSDGGSIEIKGAVDRVDMFTSGDKKYVRVVDYKSGNKKFALSDILYGLNLQMFIYLFTLSESRSEYSGISSGVLYMHSSRSLFSLDKHASDADIKKEEKKEFCMRGVVLNDKENALAKHMEHDLNGNYIPVKYVKKHDAVMGNAVTLEELGRISRKIDSLIAEMGISLHSGKIMQNPVNGKRHDKTCEFCDYTDVCRNRREVITRDTEEYSIPEVIEILKEEQDA